jgi:hypothetical protein
MTSNEQDDEIIIEFLKMWSWKWMKQCDPKKEQGDDVTKK